MKSVSSGGIVFKVTKSEEVKVLILEKNGDFLLPKGRVENGETLENAAIREIGEESGVDVTYAKNLGIIGKYEYFSDISNDFKEVYIFLFILNEEVKISPREEEGFTDGFWMDLDEAKKKVSFESLSLLIDKAHKKYID